MGQWTSPVLRCHSSRGYLFDYERPSVAWLCLDGVAHALGLHCVDGDTYVAVVQEEGPADATGWIAFSFEDEDPQPHEIWDRSHTFRRSITEAFGDWLSASNSMPRAHLLWLTVRSFEEKTSNDKVTDAIPMAGNEGKSWTSETMLAEENFRIEGTTETLMCRTGVREHFSNIRGGGRYNIRISLSKTRPADTAKRIQRNADEVSIDGSVYSIPLRLRDWANRVGVPERGHMWMWFSVNISELSPGVHALETLYKVWNSGLTVSDSAGVAFRQLEAELERLRLLAGEIQQTATPDDE